LLESSSLNGQFQLVSLARLSLNWQIQLDLLILHLVLWLEVFKC